MKIGIISLYYENYNYGGVLQAYALTKYLNKYENVTAEQICYKKTKSSHSNIYKIKIKLSYIYNKCYKRRNLMRNIKKRNLAIKEFQDNQIEHSKIVYTEKTISESEKKYDLFVTGSDQVWNPMWFDEVYRLEFVKSKICTSYAASVGTNKIDTNIKDIFKNSLKNYSAISVRENESISLLDGCSDLDIIQCIDPTLLLDFEDWRFLSSDRIINQKYVFCYFLSDDTESRNYVMEYARENNFVVVTLPYLLGSDRECDKYFGDIKLYDVSPEDFLSLIEHCEVCMTDSFHATLFSIVFRKLFISFSRNGGEEMNNRLHTLLDLFDVQDMFFSDKEIVNKNFELLKCKYEDSNFPKYNNLKNCSIKYIEKNIIKL